MSYRLLVVSGEKSWAEAAAATAVSSGHQAHRAASAAMAMTEILKGGCDLALIDVDLPSLEGLRWLEALRQTDQGRSLPVIVASKRRSDDDLSRAFELGVDDYVLKSVHPAELSARMRSVLRRRLERSPIAENAIAIGPVELDPSKHECRVRKILIEIQSTITAKPEFEPSTSTRRFSLMMSDYVATVLMTQVIQRSQTIDTNCA